MDTNYKLATKIDMVKKDLEDAINECTKVTDLLNNESVTPYIKLIRDSLSLIDDYSDYIRNQGNWCDTIETRLHEIILTQRVILEKIEES